ncbi:MAG: YfhO family protein [Gemmatimonadaceae bacterium]
MSREEQALNPSDRLGLLWASLVYAVATLALGYQALAGKFLAGPHSDEYIAGYAFREFGAATLRESGSFPLWNPYLFGGMPFVAAMHGDIFYPTFLLRMLVPTDVAMTWTFIIHIFLAGLFAYMFLRAAGFGFAGALLGGLAYMLGGQLASLVSPGHDGKLYVSALFPLALFALTRGIRDGRAWAWGLLAIVVGLAVLSPHPQLLQYMLLASGAYALFLAIRGARSGDIARPLAIRRLALALGAVFVGGLIGAIQYLPVREYVEFSPRAGGIRDYAIATSYAWPLEELLEVYLPEFAGILDSYWGVNGIHFHSEYIGAAVLLLAFAAFGGVRQSARKSEIWFWTATLVIALLWALGGDTPFYRIPYALVPGTKFFRAPETVFFVGTLAIAFLVAVGAERFLRREVKSRYLALWAGFAAVIAVFALTGILDGMAATIVRLELIQLVDANSGALKIGALRSLFFVLATAGVLYALLQRRISPMIATWALVAVVTTDLWSVMRHYWIFSPPAAITYASDPTVDYVKSQPEPSRVLPIQLDRASGLRDPNLNGDGLMSHRVRNVLGYHGNELARYDQLAGKERGFDQISNPNFWELTNTRFLLTNVDSLPLEGATRVVGPVRTAAGTTVFLYRLPGEQPFAWVTPLIVKAPDDAVLATVLDPRFRVRSAALFEPNAPVQAVPNVQSLPEESAIRVTTTSYAPGDISLLLSAPAPAGSALVVSENYYPGWKAEVDGRSAPAARVNYTLTGVELPAGARSVRLRFMSPAYATGKKITLLALALSIAALAAGVVLDRRRVA